MNVLSLCSGIGGLDLAIKLAVCGSRTVCYVEGEAYAVAVLASQMEAGTLDDAPIWSDLRTFDGNHWVGVVDCVVAGFPCQPVSQAGKRKGDQDERWLWDDVCRTINEVRPSIAFLENVPGLLTGPWLGRILGELSELGFDAEWCVLSAAEMGAPHLRRRWFCLATHPDRGGLRILAERISGRWEEGLQGERQAESFIDGEEGSMAHDDGGGCGEGADGLIQKKRDSRDHAGSESSPVPDTMHLGRDGRPENNGREARQETSEHNGWEVEPGMGRVAHGVPNRVDRLRALGNAVVPAQGAHAVRILAQRIVRAQQ